MLGSVGSRGELGVKPGGGGLTSDLLGYDIGTLAHLARCDLGAQAVPAGSFVRKQRKCSQTSGRAWSLPCPRLLWFFMLYVGLLPALWRWAEVPGEGRWGWQVSMEGASGQQAAWPDNSTALE